MHFEDLADNGEFSIKTSLQDYGLWLRQVRSFPPGYLWGICLCLFFFFLKNATNASRQGLLFCANESPKQSFGKTANPQPMEQRSKFYFLIDDGSNNCSLVIHDMVSTCHSHRAIFTLQTAQKVTGKVGQNEAAISRSSRHDTARGEPKCIFRTDLQEYHGRL